MLPDRLVEAKSFLRAVAQAHNSRRDSETSKELFGRLATSAQPFEEHRPRILPSNGQF